MTSRIAHRRRIRWVAALTAGVVVATISVTTTPGQATPGNGRHMYDATIVRTAGGVPNITAADFGSLGYGTGYAMAEDNICLIADIMLRFSAQRARFLGPQDGNLQSDFFYQLFKDRGEAAEPVDPRMAEMFTGAADGYNRYRDDVGVGKLTDPSCRGKAWVRPLRAIDFRRVSRMNFFYPAMMPQLVAAQPPSAKAGAHNATAAPASVGASVSAQRPDGAQSVYAPAYRPGGSNGVAIGGEGTVDGTGMLLANPHLPWNVGQYRFWAFHQTIPGKLNVVGANIVGRPQVGVAATENVAFTATVQTAPMQTFYKLDLVPGHPTQYYFDGEPTKMKTETVHVKVRDAGGKMTTKAHTFYSTRYGARLLGGPSYPWGTEHAYAVRATDVGWRGVNALMPQYQAKSVHDLKRIQDTYQFLPNNVIAADSEGNAYYGNVAPIPNLTDAQYAKCTTSDQFSLDGSTSACMWNHSADAAGPILGPSQLPSLIRKDFVTNSNDSYWLSNPRQPLTGFNSSLGTVGTERSLRTRSGLSMVLDRLNGTDGMPGKNFTLDQLKSLITRNSAYSGEILRDGLVTLCENNPAVTLDDGTKVDISAACPVLENWDLRDNLESRGVALFRAFLDAAGVKRTLPSTLNYVHPFDPADAVNTPRGLDPNDNPNALKALGQAVQKLRNARIPLDARLADIQYVIRKGVRIPIPGGTNAEGQFNIINGPFVDGKGYPDVTAGSSWIQATGYTDNGPVSHGVLTYGQSSNPNSPYYSVMTEMFSKKQWVNLPFSAGDVATQAIEPALRLTARRN